MQNGIESKLNDEMDNSNNQSICDKSKNNIYHLIFDNSCWIRNGHANLLYFGIPIATIIIVNGVFYSLAVFNIRKKSLAQKASKLRRFSRVKLPGDYHVKFYIQMAAIMGFTWITGFLLMVTNDNIIDLILVYIFLVLNSSMGVFIFAVFICKEEVAQLYLKLARQWISKTESSNDKKQFESRTTSVISSCSGGGGRGKGEENKKKALETNDCRQKNKKVTLCTEKSSISVNTVSTEIDTISKSEKSVSSLSRSISDEFSY